MNMIGIVRIGEGNSNNFLINKNRIDLSNESSINLYFLIDMKFV